MLHLAVVLLASLHVATASAQAPDTANELPSCSANSGSGTCAGIQEASEGSSSSHAVEEALVSWLLGMGATVGVQVRRSAAGVRGLYASRATPVGGVLAAVPLSAAIPLGSPEDTSPELAITLLRERHKSRPRYSPYFEVLPPPPPSPSSSDPGTGDAETASTAAGMPQPHGWSPSCAEELPQRAVQALAGPDLRELVLAKQRWAREVWAGAVPPPSDGRQRLTLQRAVPRRAITWEEFAWATCMVTSRSILGPAHTLLMIPLIDLANHDPSPSAELRFRSLAAAPGGGAGNGPALVGRSDISLELVATRDLAAGEQVCISYGPLRPDEALLYYNFQVPHQQQHAAAAPASGAGLQLVSAPLESCCSGLASAAAGGSSIADAPCFAACGCGATPAPAAVVGGKEVDSGSIVVARDSAPVPQLCAVDHHAYDPSARPGKGAYAPFSPTTREAGLQEAERLVRRAKQVLAEMQRQQQLQREDAAGLLRDSTCAPGTCCGAGPASCSDVGTDARPPGGELKGKSTHDAADGVMQQVLAFNELRLAGLVAEAQRLCAALWHAPEHAAGEAV